MLEAHAKPMIAAASSMDRVAGGLYKYRIRISMISFITCSIDPVKFRAFEAMCRALMRADLFELIGVHDARSLAEAYNRVIPHARGEIIVLCHDDIEILNPDFVLRLKEHLRRFDVVGVAGTDRVIGAKWMAAGPPHLFGQVVYPMPDGSFQLDIYGAPRRIVGGIEGLDGVLIAVRRSAFQRLRFDEQTFDGFHGYDLDFSLTARALGMRLAVACDINVLHASSGQFDKVWEVYEDRFVKKWLTGRMPARNQTAPVYCQWAVRMVKSRAELLEVLNPSYWRIE
jgi:glycosyltransferase involved in cell wall biosynthesis